MLPLYFNLSAKTQEISHEIMEQFMRGNPSAYLFLFNAYYPCVFQSLKRVLKNEDDAKDLTQRIFMRLWLQQTKYPSIRNVEAYLFRCMHNALVNFLQSKNRKMARITTQQERADVNSPHEHLVANDLRQRTHILIARMPKQRQKIFRLSRLSGFSNEEIAKLLGISKKTIENHLNLALGTLRKMVL